jgi:hypothetical protein
MTTTTMTKPSPIRTDADARAYLEANHPEILALFPDGATTYSYVKQCKRCGGSGIWTTYHGACFECGGRPETQRLKVTVKIKASAQKAKRDDIKRDKIRAEVAAQQARAATDRAAFLKEHDGLEAILTGSGIDIIRRFAEQLEQRGSLSAKQVEVAFSIANQRKSDDEAKTAAPEGRHTFTGKIVSVKDTFSEWGSNWRLTIKVATPDGGLWIANGNAPAALLKMAVDGLDDFRAQSIKAKLEACTTDREREDIHYAPRDEYGIPEFLKGRTVTMTGTLTQGDDAHFAFFKRPTKPSLAD